MKSLGIIPARYSSTRLPAKPLAQIGEKAMVKWVYDAAIASNLDKAVVATDNQIIADYCVEHGISVVMTPEDCQTGTERVIQVANIPEYKTYDVYVNIQGDEPLIQPGDINDLLVSMQPWLKTYGENIVGTLVTNLDKHEALERSSVKALFRNSSSQISMFTRSAIYDYDQLVIENIRKHIGIYAFTNKSLQNISKLKDRTDNEIAESLEQLRWMDSGIKLIGEFTNTKLVSVDTWDDLNKVKKHVEENL
jgi:3-deoxy-manno-octulosonate cytidylyltransferase (CMP-KDO synthetase)